MYKLIYEKTNLWLTADVKATNFQLSAGVWIFISGVSSGEVLELFKPILFYFKSEDGSNHSPSYNVDIRVLNAVSGWLITEWSSFLWRLYLIYSGLEKGSQSQGFGSQNSGDGCRIRGSTERVSTYTDEEVSRGGN